MSKDEQLEAAIKFIMDNFTNGNNEFYCMSQHDCSNGDCDNCQVRKDFINITGIEE